MYCKLEHHVNRVWYRFQQNIVLFLRKINERWATITSDVMRLSSRRLFILALNSPKWKFREFPLTFLDTFYMSFVVTHSTAAAKLNNCIHGAKYTDIDIICYFSERLQNPVYLK